MFGGSVVREEMIGMQGSVGDGMMNENEESSSARWAGPVSTFHCKVWEIREVREGVKFGLLHACN